MPYDATHGHHAAWRRCGGFGRARCRGAGGAAAQFLRCAGAGGRADGLGACARCACDRRGQSRRRSRCSTRRAQWGSDGADIAVGEGQPLGVPLASGGPYFGFMACSRALVRQMPGRIVGRTAAMPRARPGYTLTLQAREQHIRRSKATSNICTNQGLVVTAATIHMALLGPEGLRRVARACHANLLDAARGAWRDRRRGRGRFPAPGVSRVRAAPRRLRRAECSSRSGRVASSAGFDLGRDYPELGDGAAGLRDRDQDGGGPRSLCRGTGARHRPSAAGPRLCAAIRSLPLNQRRSNMASVTLGGNPDPGRRQVSEEGRHRARFQPDQQGPEGRRASRTSRASARCSTSCRAWIRRSARSRPRVFNERASRLANTVVLVISADLPFAQGRFCGGRGPQQRRDAVHAARPRLPQALWRGHHRRTARRV